MYVVTWVAGNVGIVYKRCSDDDVVEFVGLLTELGFEPEVHIVEGDEDVRLVY